MVKVSVIVPVYNVDKYLEECLDSIINQTLKDIEIICVNDGSTDSSLKILENYASKDDRIKIITQENGGLSVARNTGIGAAIGEYISFVDSDDFIELSMFDKMYNQAHSQDLDILFCKSYLYDDITGDIDDSAPYFSLKPFNDLNKDVFNHFDTVDFIHKISVTAWSKLFKREFIFNNEFKFHPGLVFEDTPFFFETYLNADRMGICPDFFYFYRINREGSLIKSKDLSDVVIVYKLIREFLYQKNLLNIYKKQVYNGNINVIFERYNETADRFKPKFLDLMKEEFNEIITYDIVDGDDFRINFDDLSNKNRLNISNVLKAKNPLEFEYLTLLDENKKLKNQNEKLLNKNRKLKKEFKKEKRNYIALKNSNTSKIKKLFRKIKN